MDSFENLQVGVEDRIAVVKIDRPEVLNALDEKTIDELEAVFQALLENPNVGAVIITGSGEKAFVAGADIQALSRLTPLQAKQASQRGQQVFSRIEQSPKPVVAAINGFCLGGGCELALCCHIRIASSGARLGQPEVKLGILPGYGGSQRLSRLVGRGQALELILSGDMISAQEAARIGLVNRVVDSDQLLPECRKLAARILSNGPLAVRYSIEAVNVGMEMPLDQGQSLESTLFGLAFSSRDAKEGMQAFLEKRKPVFQGD